ncbi:transcription factor that binds to CRE motif [Purpureocillium takamizusanense]|uniref:Transcription factor that binds to CRE motif n=1 Tax=Purpureocillium takamizusanense TaxID=2060973 RepID=A0A9Q8QNE1_9HYPO|nr:transcription factor that binds to CRE motif [Purpureocillium takamizusanense]UNI22346.1 transcription factor that binds to CRE motif [Purpureocillium takamizusanense]
MALQQTSPMANLEASPVESFVSTPGDSYPSLFSTTTPSSPSATINPMDMMTPKSYVDDAQSSRLSVVPEDLTSAEAEAEAEVSPESSDKKPAKKRKSWGQVLPEPKTNLPPRKRAKTEDEKEQRRVERVLRNRRAAQSSRERKRLEVEALEKKTKELETALANAEKANKLLAAELNRVRRASGVGACASSPLDPLRDNQITLSQQLFSSQDGLKIMSDSAANLVDQLMLSNSNPTVNPASLSPELGPVSDAKPESAESSEQTMVTSPDLTQRPAEMLCDLPCHTSAEVPKSFTDSQTQSPLLAWTLFLRMTMISASAILSACQRPLMQIAMSSKARFSLLPTPQLLTTIIWLVTLPPASQVSTPSTSTTSSTTRQTTPPLTLWQRATSPLRTTVSSRKSTTLRFKSLRQILSSSPNLARPLMDATMEALRLVSAEGCDDRVENLRSESGVTRDEVRQLTQCLSDITLPSQEVLVTLLWALKVEERRIQKRNRSEVLRPDSGILSDTAANNYILKVTPGTKRSRQAGGGAPKRLRLT